VLYIFPVFQAFSMKKKTIPQHIAFEVEDLQTRNCYTLVYDSEIGIVTLLNTSRHIGKAVMQTFGKDSPHTPFPDEHKNAFEHYCSLYAKALDPKSPIAFIGYVDKDTIEPINYIDPDFHKHVIVPQPCE